MSNDNEKNSLTFQIPKGKGLEFLQKFWDENESKYDTIEERVSDLEFLFERVEKNLESMKYLLTLIKKEIKK